MTDRWIIEFFKEEWTASAVVGRSGEPLPRLLRAYDMTSKNALAHGGGVMHPYRARNLTTGQLLMLPVKS